MVTFWTYAGESGTTLNEHTILFLSVEIKPHMDFIFVETSQQVI